MEGFSLFFAIFENGYQVHSYRFAIFLGVQLKKSANFARQKFHFQKITGTLKMYIFFCWHEPSFSYIKGQLPKIEFKISGCLEFFYSSKMAKTVFDLKKSKKILFRVSFHFWL